MIYVNSVTATLHNLLAADPVMASSGFTVQEGETFNQDLNLTPWVGVYYGNLNLAPHTIGGSQPWGAELEVFLYVQEGSHRSGQEATRLLGQAQAVVLNALNGDKHMGGAVRIIKALDITPFQRDLAEDSWLFTNEIALKAELRGG